MAHPGFESSRGEVESSPHGRGLRPFDRFEELALKVFQIADRATSSVLSQANYRRG